MNRSRSVYLYLCPMILLMACMPAWADPGRGVYVNGSVYKVWIQNGNVYAGRQAVANFLASNYTPAGIFAPEITDVLKNADNSTYQLCRKTTKVTGEGLAVLGNKILYAYTADASCSNSNGMIAYVATFDATPGVEKWVPGSVYPLGWVNKCCNNGAGTGSGAAIVVVNNQVTVFTDNGTYMSSDGVNWSLFAYDLLFGGSVGSVTDSRNYEPLDAVAFNPPNAAARALIVYGYQDFPGAVFNYLYSATWDGKTNVVDPYSLQQISSNTPITGNLSLFTGTANMGTWSGANPAKEPAVQLFASGNPFSSTNANGAIRHFEYRYTSLNPATYTRGSWIPDGTLYPNSGTSVKGLFVFPTFALQCDSGNAAAKVFQATSQVLYANWSDGTAKREMHAVSDWLVPMNKENITACGDISGTVNNTAGFSADVAQHYWTLVGVILGTPPFLDSHLIEDPPPFDYDSISKLSKVSYAESMTKDHESTHEMSNQLMLSAGTEVRVGVPEKTGVSVSLDAGWKHAWESSNGTSSSTKTTFTKTFGADDTSVETLGKWGWALFNVPQLIVQDWQLYAYDYDYHTGTGTQLAQNMETINQLAGSGNIVQQSFELADPSSINPLMAGMTPFADSQDLTFWAHPRDPSTGAEWDWERGQLWRPRLGEGGHGDTQVPLLTYTSGSGSDLTYTIDTADINSSGNTNEIEFKETTQIGVGTKLIGVKDTLSIGYDGKFSFKQTDSTKTGTEFTANLHPKDCGVEVSAFSIQSNIVTFTGKNYTLATPDKPRLQVGERFSFPEAKYGGLQIGTYLNQVWLTVLPTGLSTTQFQASFTHPDVTQTLDETTAYASDCVTDLLVQPYWLEATDPRAPWIPTAFKSQYPWCITWKVVSASPNPASGTAGMTLGVAGSRFGQALPPGNAGGRIVAGSGGGEGGNMYSHYSIQGGRLATLDAQGTETRIPMTADQFDPAKGVSVQVEGMSWSSLGSLGAWQRSGDLWIFESDNSAGDTRVTLTLDFGSAAYDLQIQKANLNGRVLAGVRNTQLVIIINQLYTFQTALQHDVNLSWQWSQPSEDSKTMHVTSFAGRYNSATEQGNMSLAGTLPAVLPSFGDIQIKVNDHPFAASLLKMDNFREAFLTGGVLKYSKKGANITIDFGKKTWSATFNEQAFHNAFVPRWGTFRTSVLVGGTPLFTSDNAVLNYSANLTLKH